MSGPVPDGTPAFRDLVTSPERAASYRAKGLWNGETLASRVCAHAALRPNAAAVVDDLGARMHTYRELLEDSAALAQGMSRMGVRRGDAVSIQLPNSYEAVVAAVATQTLGAVINPLLTNYRARELTHVFSTARTKLIFTPREYRGWDYRAMVADVRRTSRVEALHVVVGDVGGDTGFEQLIQAHRTHDGTLTSLQGDHAVSELIFTSGTEATPKAIMHTEDNANFAVRSLFADLRIPADAVVWMPSPVGHSTGFNYGTRAALYHGLPLVLQDRWNAADAVELVRRFGCSYTLAATTFLQDLVEECERTGARLTSLTHFGCGGAPVPAELVDRAEAVGIGVLRLYGSTEVLCATWNRPWSPQEKRRSTDGAALSEVDTEIRDPDGRPITIPGEGELHVRGPNSSVGFFQDAERTMATYLEDGWICSGDMVTIDAEQYVTVVGRKKEIIIRGGVNIAPREIEDLITTFPEVSRVAVVGVPDPRLGERSCACVVLRPGSQLTLEVMTTRLKAGGLATYKLPERLEIMADLPSTASGKIQKHEIPKRLAERDDSRPGGGRRA